MEIKFTVASGYFGLTGVPRYQPLPSVEDRDALTRPLLDVEFTCAWLPPAFQDRLAAQIQAAFAALYAEYQARQEEG